jgi:hypothetical protein
MDWPKIVDMVVGIAALGGAGRVGRLACLDAMAMSDGLLC